MSHIAAVIFDYGNVLSDVQDNAAVEAMAGVLKLDPQSFQRAYWQFRVAYDEAALSPESYWHAVSGSADRTVQSGDIRRLRRLDVESWVLPNLPMVEWAKRLRDAGTKTAVLSNMPVDLRDYVLGSETWLPEFDAMTFSCDLHCSKPDARIYRDCLERLGTPPTETLFLDDREPNVEAARAIGMHSIVFTGARTALLEIESQFSIQTRRDGRFSRP